MAAKNKVIIYVTGTTYEGRQRPLKKMYLRYSKIGRAHV